MDRGELSLGDRTCTLQRSPIILEKKKKKKTGWKASLYVILKAWHFWSAHHRAIAAFLNEDSHIYTQDLLFPESSSGGLQIRGTEIKNLNCQFALCLIV